jgi:1,4-dihydroxy-6-naphthoate synthase
LKLTLGFSPCPNDTFIFDALVNKKIDTGGLDFEVLLEDVETLNQWAFEDRLAVSKLSFATWVQVAAQYRLLESGAALGRGVGPLLIGAQPFAGTGLEALRAAVARHPVALPGRHTTAHLLFRYAFPQAQQKEFQAFHQIENTVLQSAAQASEAQQYLGVIIHENRFTYQNKGLHQWLDLGAYWEQQTGLPIPLGGIAIKKELGEDVAVQVSALIRASLEYAFERYPVLPAYVRRHAQEMDEAVMRQHIDLYVNEYSLQLDEEAWKAIALMQHLPG